ncbi:hypothetical protein BSLG_005741 [Batrachochytrium salamandrivorans]|nr:hypothetical protein BSLG_005741 [Batrachochytrium salamandrivorans]
MSRGGSSSPNAESILSANLTVQACVDICSSNSKAFALLGGAACRCITSKSALESTTYTVNMPECSLVCSDGLPCSSSVALNRFSVYNVTEASLPQQMDPKTDLKTKGNPCYTMIDSSGSTEYLIPKLLPRTPNQLYSVYAVYKARRQDELSLGLKQVVAIRNTYSDGWAMGTDLSTGAAVYSL